MTEQSLLTDDVRALVGTTAAGGITHVTANSVRRAHEVYYGTPGDVPADGEDVPGITIAALATETGGINLPSLMPNTLLISNEWEFQRPLRLGEELQVRSRLADISERFGGRFGYSLYFRTDVEFLDASGEVIARSGTTMMQYDARNARGGDDE